MSLSVVTTAEGLCEGLNPNQIQAVMAPLDAAVQVMAGAGTGKTELITRRFAKLTLDLMALEQPNPTERLWVCTFTQRAAEEMKQRIARYMAQSIGASLSSRPWIGTFHSLCHRMISQHPEELQHLAGFSLLSDLEMEVLREQLVLSLLSGIPAEWDAVVTAYGLPPLSPLLAAENLLSLDFGGYERLFLEIVFTVLPRIKAAGFTPQGFYQAAMQQTHQLTDLIMGIPVSDGVGGEIWVDHDAYARGWRKHLDGICCSRFSFYPTEWEMEIHAQKALSQQKPVPSMGQLLKENLKPLYKADCFVSYNGRKKNNPFSPALQDFSPLKNAVAIEKQLIAMVSGIYALYQHTLRTDKICDYDDLIQETLSLLKTFPAIREAYHRQFAHLMVDEFQDSNGAQLQLIQLLYGQDRPRMTVVGDKKQSIYGFRYAEPENLAVLFDGLSACQRIPLEINYRSQSPILAMANRITEMMALDPPEPLVAGLASSAETSDALTWFCVTDATSVGEAKAMEVQWIAQTIAELLHQDAVQPREIAVLVQSHQKGLQVEAALDALGIPSIKQRNLGFFTSPCIRRAMALLELAENPYQDFALVTLLQETMSHRQLYLLAQHREHIRAAMGLETLSYFEAMAAILQQPEAAHPELAALQSFFYTVVSTLEQCAQRATMLRPSLLLAWLLKSFPVLPDDVGDSLTHRKATKQLRLLKNILAHWDTRTPQGTTLAEALALLRRYREQNDLEMPMAEDAFTENAVRILTVHGAKGLEFPIVFLAGVDIHRKNRTEGLLTFDPQYPGKLGFGLILNRLDGEKTLKKLVYDTVWQIPRNQQEALRLLYVGVTRAKHKLYVSSWPQSFPYLNPAFFADVSIQHLSSETVAWRTPQESQVLAQAFQSQYSATDISESLPWEMVRPFSASLPKPLSSKPSAAPVAVSVTTLQQFLQCPAKGMLHYLYGLGSQSGKDAAAPMPLAWVCVSQAYGAKASSQPGDRWQSVAEAFLELLENGPLFPKPEGDPPCHDCTYQALCPHAP